MGSGVSFYAFLFYIFFVPGVILANGIKITPVRLDLSNQVPVATLKITNPSDAPLSVQTQLMRWTQSKGTDHYEVSQDILVMPPLFTVAPRQTQIMRLAFRQYAGEEELAYRLYLKEIKPAQDLNPSALNMTLRIGIPIFVSPGGKIKAQYTWKIKNVANKGVLVTLKNEGNKTLFVDSLSLLGENGTLLSKGSRVFKYIFPKQDYQWTFIIKNTAFERGYKLKARVNGCEIISELRMDSDPQ